VRSIAVSIYIWVIFAIFKAAEIPAIENKCEIRYVDIKCQLDATDVFNCRSYCLLNMLRAPLCPSSGARDYYTVGCRLWYLVLGFQVVGMVWS
jgi:hypothetical protein